MRTHKRGDKRSNSEAMTTLQDAGTEKLKNILPDKKTFLQIRMVVDNAPEL